MILKFRFLLLAICLFGCTEKEESKEKWANLFLNNNLVGTFVLYNVDTKETQFHNESRANKQFIPASTFKILNSLISLENHVVKDENEIIKWDGIKRNYKVWNKDQSMKTAMPISCVWFYQELARRIGEDSMQNIINKVGYGNQLMGSNIDDFWLIGDLEISAVEQIELLDRLIKDKLPFEKNNQDIVKRIMVTDSTSSYVIHSKTGWADGVNPPVGWNVGWIETDANTYIFALNIEVNKRSQLKYRKEILYNILKEESIITTN